MKPIYNRFLKEHSQQVNSRKFPAILVLVLLMICSMSTTRLSAQNEIGFSVQSFIGMPDTVAAGDNWIVAAIVQNSPTSILSLVNDTVQLVGYIDTAGPFTPIFFPPIDSVSLNPGDTAFFLLPITFDVSFAGFHIGNNVIVVWPITTNPNFDTGDTITANVIILDGISTGPEPEPGEVRCYPVPADGPLFITSTNRSLVVKEVIVRDATGKIVTVSDNPAAGISTHEWATGIYLLEITFENGQKANYKVIR